MLATSMLLLRVLLAVSLILFSYIAQPLAQAFIVAFALICLFSLLKRSFAEAVLSFRCYETISLAFGAFVPWAALAGSASLLIITLLYLFFVLPLLLPGAYAGDKKQVRALKTYLFYATPFLLLMASWTGLFIWLGFDLELLKQVYLGLDGPPGSSADIENIAMALGSSMPAWLDCWRSFLRVFAIIALIGLFMKEESLRLSFAKGLITGACLGGFLSLIQLLGGFREYFPNQSNLWDQLKRHVGCFSDANAFGVFSALLLPFLFASCRNSLSLLLAQGVKRLNPAGIKAAAYLDRGRFVFLAALLLGWLCLGSMAGSRSYFAALVVYLFIILASYSKKALLLGLALIVGGILGLNLLQYAYPELLAQICSTMPFGLQRVLSSLNFSEASNALFSRSAFLRISWASWLDHPLLGLGFEQFRYSVPAYAAKLGIATAVWTDNSNNFYMGLLAETGLLGLATFVFFVTGLRWRKAEESLELSQMQIAAKVAVLCLVLLLVFGPHLEFDEVAVLVAFLIASACDPLAPKKSSLGKRGFVYIGLCALVPLCIFLQFDKVQFGFYFWEPGGDGMLRWTTRKAFGRSLCQDDGMASLKIALLHPDLAQRPVEIRLSSAGRERLLKTFSRPGVSVLRWSCVSTSQSNLSKEKEASYVPYQLVVSRAWSPKLYALGNDRRLLGVQVLGAD